MNGSPARPFRRDGVTGQGGPGGGYLAGCVSRCPYLGAAVPDASTVRCSPGADVAKLVPVVADGTVCLLASTGGHLIADVAGWFSV